jgi:DNA-binding NtrC family response regulator
MIHADNRSKVGRNTSRPCRVLFVDDDDDARELVSIALTAHGFEIVTAASGEAALEVLESDDIDVVVTDVRMGAMDGITLCERIAQLDESLPVIVVTAFGEAETAVAAIRASADDFVTKPLNIAQLEIVLDRAVRDRRLHQQVARLSDLLDHASSKTILGRTPQMKRIFDVIDQIAATNTTVLITGESGTGKELVARAIHDASGRSGRFVAVNCAAMPASLLESELFGHVKGAFTDAVSTRRGLCLQAHDGTLFLDEIGEMPMEMQVKLLRVLQEREVRPVGGDETIKMTARIITATNRELGAAVAAGSFREDLYYRIAIVPIQVPPLRDRADDILPLAQRFVERAAIRMGKGVTGLSVTAASRLLEHDWPGNVRELENTMNRAVALTRAHEILAEDLPDRIRDRSHLLHSPVGPEEALPTLEEVERRHVIHVLRAMEGNRTQAAKVLGVNRRTLYRRLNRLNIDEQLLSTSGS